MDHRQADDQGGFSRVYVKRGSPRPQPSPGRVYSPDLDALPAEVEGPIEQVFAKLKHLLRKAAERTNAATWHRIGTLFITLQPAAAV